MIERQPRQICRYARIQPEPHVAHNDERGAVTVTRGPLSIAPNVAGRSARSAIDACTGFPSQIEDPDRAVGRDVRSDRERPTPRCGRPAWRLAWGWHHWRSTATRRCGGDRECATARDRRVERPDPRPCSEQRRSYRSTFGRTEDKLVGLRCRHCGQLDEGIANKRRDGDRSQACLRLGRSEVDGRLDVHQGLDDLDPLVDQIDTTPAQAEQLAETEPAESCDEDEGAISMVDGVGQLPHVVGGEEAHLFVLDLRKRQLSDGVVLNQTILHRGVDAFVQRRRTLAGRESGRTARRGPACLL